ncbi:transposase, partial [Bacillus cereus]
SIHQSAAFTIGRRGLGYKEKVPRVLQPQEVLQIERLNLFESEKKKLAKLFA